MRVGGDEAGVVGGEPGQRGPDRPRQRDRALRLERAAVHGQAASASSTRAPVTTRIPTSSSSAAALAGRGAEQRQRCVLGRVDGHVDVGPHSARLPRRHQGELVRGQRPRHHRGHDEADARRVPLLEIASRPPNSSWSVSGVQVSAWRSAVSLRAPTATSSASYASRSPSSSTTWRSPGSTAVTARARGRRRCAGRGGERMARGVPARERRGHGHGAEHELALRRDQRQRDAIAGEIAQREMASRPARRRRRPPP